MELLTLSIDEACAALGIGRNLGYRLAAEGRLPVVRLGKRLRVSKVGLDQLLAGGWQPAAGEPRRQ